MKKPVTVFAEAVKVSPTAFPPVKVALAIVGAARLKVTVVCVEDLTK